MPSFSHTSASKLDTCDKRLQDLFNEVVRHRDCTILEGHRGQEAQEKAFAEGKSHARWGQSKHNSSPSQAVDVAPYPIDWNDLQRFRDFANFVKGVAAGMHIKVRWGGDFQTLVDMPHWELLPHETDA